MGQCASYLAQLVHEQKQVVLGNPYIPSVGQEICFNLPTPPHLSSQQHGTSVPTQSYPLPASGGISIPGKANFPVLAFLKPNSGIGNGKNPGGKFISTCSFDRQK